VCVFAPSCTPGANGCACAGGACTDSNAECSADDTCLLTKTGECTLGESGCECKADGTCDSANDVCDEIGNVCTSPVCEPGSPGCECADERCRAGFDCKSNKCIVATCPAGQPGCACADGAQKCAVKGFECKAFTTDGSDARCVAKGKNCGDQTARCIKYCGVGRVLKCPACSNQVPVCDEGNSAGAVLPSALVAVVLAALALLF